MFTRSGSASIGLYIGKGLQNHGVSAFALKALEDNLHNLTVNAGSVAMQLCDPHQKNVHTFGLMASSNLTFASVQDAMKTWSNGGCISFDDSKSIAGPAVLTTALKSSVNVTRSTAITSSASRLNVRAECSTEQVHGGDICDTLAERCGISVDDLRTYNPGSDVCTNLMPGQHICCSEGTLPDFSPKPNEDGSCHTYKIVADDNCSNLAAEFSLDKEDIEEFNENTWGWNGCDNNIWQGTVICLSKGSPPMPDPLENAVCGP